MTRIKDDTRYEVIEHRPVTPAKNVVSDERDSLDIASKPQALSPILRLVTIETETGKRLQFLTNHMTLAASTISEIYKDRGRSKYFSNC